MNHVVTRGIVLSRTNYGEADRIITLLTPDHGKVRLMARGVRKAKSKLAGGIELFSVSDITFIRGRGEIGTLISSRLVRHYGRIVGTIDRVQLGYDLIKMLDQVTEDHPEKAYFELLEQVFSALDEPSIGTELIQLWFEARILQLGGHTPDLANDVTGKPLQPGESYTFDFQAAGFTQGSNNTFAANHIKFLRLALDGHYPGTLAQIKDVEILLPACRQLIQTMLQTYVHTSG